MSGHLGIESVLARHFDDIGERVVVERRFAEVIEAGPVEPNRSSGRRPRTLTVAAALLIVFGVGALLIVNRTGSETDTTASLDLPVVCERGTATTGGDDTLPALDQSAPGFITALPADASVAELVVRATLNPPSGPGCLAYDADRINLAAGPNADVVDVALSLADGSTLDVDLTLKRTAALVGITAIAGHTSFDIVTTRDGTTLSLDGLPERAARVAIDIDASNTSSTLTVPVDSAERVELRDGDGRLIRLVQRVRFTVLDADGDVLDIGGRAFELVLPACAPDTPVACVAEVESFGSAFLNEIALDFRTDIDIEAGTCSRGGRDDESVLLCAIPMSDDRTVLLADSRLNDLTIRATTRAGDSVDVPLPPVPGIAVVVHTGTGDYSVLSPTDELVLSVSASTQATLEVPD